MVENFTVIVDVILIVLGAYLTFIGIKSTKSNDVDPMIFPAEEIAKCNDIPGLSKYIMPKTAIFGGVCFVLGILGFLNDTERIPFNDVVNFIFYTVFFAILIVYVACLRRARKRYIQ